MRTLGNQEAHYRGFVHSLGNQMARFGGFTLYHLLRLMMRCPLKSGHHSPHRLIKEQCTHKSNQVGHP